MPKIIYVYPLINYIHPYLNRLRFFLLKFKRYVYSYITIARPYQINTSLYPTFPISTIALNLPLLKLYDYVSFY